MQRETSLNATGRPQSLRRLKLVVLGATGGTGLELVKQALGRGHLVTAFVRSPERLKDFRDHINVRPGDLLNSASLQEVIQGHDAVLSGFGPRAPRSEADSNLLERFAQTLTAAMPPAGVRRVVVESVAFLFKNSILPPAYLLGRLFLPKTVSDASAMERIFANTALDWTMVRPPELTDKPYTGKYRVQEGHLPLFGLKISRADVADLMINLAENGTSIRKVVGIAN
jgi:putative NADH-flavin reductase